MKILSATTDATKKLRNIHDVFFIRHIWIQLNSRMSPLKRSIYFWLLHPKIIVQHIVQSHYLVVIISPS